MVFARFAERLLPINLLIAVLFPAATLWATYEWIYFGYLSNRAKKRALLFKRSTRIVSDLFLSEILGEAISACACPATSGYGLNAFANRDGVLGARSSIESDWKSLSPAIARLCWPWCISAVSTTSFIGCELKVLRLLFIRNKDPES